MVTLCGVAGERDERVDVDMAFDFLGDRIERRVDARGIIAPAPCDAEPGEQRAPRVCWCGRADCVETWLSGPALAADHAAMTGQRLDAAQVVAAMRAGDAAAQASVERYAARLARALAQVINLLDPDVIVLGGGMSNVAALYDAVPRLWAPQVFSDSVRTVLAPARHGDSSGVRGAAWLAARPEVSNG